MVGPSCLSRLSITDGLGRSLHVGLMCVANWCMFYCEHFTSLSLDSVDYTIFASIQVPLSP